MSELVVWVERTAEQHGPEGEHAADVALTRLASAAAALRDRAGLIFGLAQPPEGLDGHDELSRRCCMQLRSWLDSGRLDREARKSCHALIERFELDVPGHERRRRPSEQGLRLLRNPTPVSVKPLGPDIGEIVTFDASECVGRIRMTDGRTLRFGATALAGAVPEVGMIVRVLDIGPHPLGGEQARTVERHSLW